MNFTNTFLPIIRRECFWTRYPASSKDREDQRQNVQRLYAYEQKPLRPVMAETTSLYSFEAR